MDAEPKKELHERLRCAYAAKRKIAESSETVHRCINTTVMQSIGAASRMQRWLRVYDLRAVDFDLPLIPLNDDLVGSSMEQATKLSNLCGEAALIAESLTKLGCFQLYILFFPAYLFRETAWQHVILPTHESVNALSPIAILWAFINVEA